MRHRAFLDVLGPIEIDPSGSPASIGHALVDRTSEAGALPELPIEEALGRRVLKIPVVDELRFRVPLASAARIEGPRVLSSFGPLNANEKVDDVSATS